MLSVQSGGHRENILSRGFHSGKCPGPGAAYTGYGSQTCFTGGPRLCLEALPGHRPLWLLPLPFASGLVLEGEGAVILPGALRAPAEVG